MNGHEYLKKFLQEENFRFTEEEGFYNFKVEGVSYFAFKNDSPFLQIMLMCEVPQVEREKILELCNEMNSNKFVAKFTLVNDRIWCSCELIPNERMVGEDWMILFSILDRSSDELLEKMREL